MSLMPFEMENWSSIEQGESIGLHFKSYIVNWENIKVS